MSTTRRLLTPHRLLPESFDQESLDDPCEENATGALWGGPWGLLLGTAFFAVPGIGTVLVGSPLVAGHADRVGLDHRRREFN